MDDFKGQSMEQEALTNFLDHQAIGVLLTSSKIPFLVAFHREDDFCLLLDFLSSTNNGYGLLPETPVKAQLITLNAEGAVWRSVKINGVLTEIDDKNDYSVKVIEDGLSLSVQYELNIEDVHGWERVSPVPKHSQNAEE